MRGRVDAWLFICIIVLLVGGFFIFSSAALGVLARQNISLSGLLFSQFVMGLGGGIFAALLALSFPIKSLRPYAIPAFIATAVGCLLVFVPHLGTSINGSHRWISIAGVSIQPSEFMKVTFIFALAHFLARGKGQYADFRSGLIPFVAMIGVCGVLLLAQPDFGTFLIIAMSGIAMYWAAGAPWRDVGILAVIFLVVITGVLFTKPYIMDRVRTYIDPQKADPLGAGYQVQQSLIAVGSGGMFGRGYGQSVQKFGYLPEPISDSIFSVAAEEFGFLGATIILIAYISFALRGLSIAARAPDLFGGLAAIGIVILILAQSFLNIAAILGVVPLTGEPLVFISHGGTAMLVSLAAVGLLLNISRSVRPAPSRVLKAKAA